MTNLQALSYSTQDPIVGEYRLRNCCLRETRDGRQYLRVQLEDMSCSVPAYVWQEDLCQRFYLPDHSLVRIEGQSQYYKDLLRIHLNHIEPISQKRTGDVVRLIPRSVCPLPGLLNPLQDAINEITIPELKQFAESVLANDGIAFAFVSAPASLDHHHSYPGGLLEHILQSFEIVSSQKKWFSRKDYELALISVLFHDIGKVLTMTYNMQRTSLGNFFEHDKLTFEVLDPYLARLKRIWPAAAEQLRFLLKWKIKREVPEYNIADLVACSDRLSAGFSMDQKRLQTGKGYEKGNAVNWSRPATKRCSSNVTGTYPL